MGARHLASADDAPRDLDQILADRRGEIALLRRRGAGPVADALEELIDEVARVTEDFRRFLSEPDAEIRSGKRTRWLRARFAEWSAQGNARIRNGQREYRMLVIPQRAHLERARLAGLRGERPR